MELTGRFADAIQAGADFSPDNAFDITTREYADDFVDWWGLDDSEPPEEVSREEWLDLRKLYGLAHEVAEIASTLLRRRGVGPARFALAQQLADEAKQHQEAIDRFVAQVKPHLETEDQFKLFLAVQPVAADDPRTRHHVFRNALQLEAIGLFPYSPQQIADRLVRLTSFLVQHSNARTSAYLSRVAHCFVLNMRTEMAAMCRAVLDTALQDYIDDDKVRRRIGASRHVTMDRRLEYCRAEGVFDADAASRADTIKSAGDDAVHTAPDLAPEPELLLENLTLVLHALDKHFKG